MATKITKYPQFGAQAGFTRTSYTNRSDQAELQVGRHTEVLVRSTTRECSATKSDCSWGVEPSVEGTDTLILDSIRLTVEDEPDMNYTAAQTGTVDPDLPLVQVKCCVIKRGRITMTIGGKGNPAYTLGETTRPTTLKTAIGSLDMGPVITSLEAAGAVFRIISYTINDTEADWQSWTAEYQSFVDSDEDGNSVAQPFVIAAGVEPPACTCTTSDCCDSYRVEWTLNGTGYAEITGTVTKNPMKPSSY